MPAGNTTCLGLEWPGRTVVYDAGTGFIRFGEYLLDLMAQGHEESRSIDLIMSHCHLDHINGLLFSPLTYDKRVRITLRACPATLSALHKLLDPSSSSCRTFLPSTFPDMVAIKEMVTVEPGSSFNLGDAKVETMALRHPGGSLGFRVSLGGVSMVLASDNEHPGPGVDPALARFSEGAQVLYTEGQYTRREYDGLDAIGNGLPMPRKGWGHSTMEDCVATATAAGCQRLFLGHHDPLRPLDKLEALGMAMKDLAGRNGPLVEMAREGQAIHLG
jgi:phosphoribosyl 1,2-cyclic phosphodiesterase